MDSSAIESVDCSGAVAAADDHAAEGIVKQTAPEVGASAEAVLTLSPEQLDALANRIAERLGQPEEDRWLPAREAAAYVGRHVDTLRKAARERRLEVGQGGANAKLFFRRSELDRWAREGGR
jgi:hypothetical protein